MLTENGLAVKLVRENVLAYFRGLNQNDYVGSPDDRTKCPLMQYLESLNIYTKGSFQIDYNHIIHSNGDLEIIPVWAREFVEHLIDLDNETVTGLRVKDIVGVLDGSIVREEKTYRFNELSEKVQQKLYDAWVESLDMDGWADDSISNLEVDLENELQGENIKIDFSGGFWSQGDGISFTGKINVSHFISETTGSERDYPLLVYVMSKGDLYDDYVEVYRINDRYFHSRSVKVGKVEFSGDATDIEDYLEEEVDNLQSHMQEWIQDRCNDMLHDLEREYDSLISFESFVDAELEAENYYYEDGTLVD